MGIRVLVADHQLLIRGGLCLFLSAQPGIEVVAQAGDGAEAARLARQYAPDVVLMETGLPGVDGIEATRRITSASVSTHVLVLTAQQTPAVAFAALRAGASGFLLKDTAPEMLLSALRAVAAGGAWLDPVVAATFIHEFVRHPSAGPAHAPDFARLTKREREVLVLIAQGLSNEEIAAHLYVAECTVKTHLTRILTKLGSRDRAQAVAMAYRGGLIRVPRPPTDAAA
jgi:DNA-binding NarL/FixJ family response regulator